MLGAEPHVRIGREVKDHVRAVHGGRQRRRIERIAGDQRERRMRPREREKLMLTGGEIVEGDDPMAVGKKTIDEGAADETGAAGDECMHLLTLAVFGRRSTVYGRR